MPLTTYYTQHRQELVARAASYLHGDVMAAEDMVQEVFLRLLSSGCLVSEATLPALAGTLLHHLLCDHWRRRQCREAAHQQLRHTLSGSADDTFALCSAAQIEELLQQKMAQMKPKLCKVLRMSIGEGMPVSEIAQQLGLNYKTAESQLLTGRKELRRYLRRVI